MTEAGVPDAHDDALWMFDLADIDNQLFTQFLDDAVQNPSYRNQLATWFNLLNN